MTREVLVSNFKQQNSFLPFRCQGRNVLQFQAMVMRDPSAGRTIRANCRTYWKLERMIIRFRCYFVASVFLFLLCFPLVCCFQPNSLQTLLEECTQTTCATLVASTLTACAVLREPAPATLVLLETSARLGARPAAVVDGRVAVWAAGPRKQANTHIRQANVLVPFVNSNELGNCKRLYS